jgi:Ca2+:H+ antiporter
LSVVLPIIACVLLVAIWGRPLGWVLILLTATGLVAAVVLSVHHAEIIALGLANPSGRLFWRWQSP